MKALTQHAYNKIVREIATLYERAGRVVVRTYWEIGKRIVEVEQSGSVRAQRGEQILKRLSLDLSSRYGRGFSLTNMKRMRMFYCQNRKGPPADLFSWTSRVELLSVKDPAKRKHIEKKAIKEKLSKRTLRKLIQDENRTKQAHASQIGRAHV